MSEQGLFQSAIRSLKKPQGESRLKKILFAIRKEIDWPNKRDNIIKLREEGCLKHLVLCLQQKDTNLVDISLSILGNCCLDQSCARDVVRKYGILPYLDSILSNHKLDSIYGRVFRIVGNICHHWERLANIVVEKQPSLVSNIVKIIISDSADSDDESEVKLSQATIIMGIRALRELLNGSVAEELIVKHEVIKAASTILIKYTSGWLESKENEDILKNVLRFLLCYSKYEYREILFGLQNTIRGSAISYLGKLTTLSPYDVVRIIMNLVRLSTVTTDLPVAEVTKILIENLKSERNAEMKKREYLKCLCFLIQCAANREEMKKLGVIAALIDFLRSSQTPSDITLKNCYLIISRLRSCMFDDTSMEMMIKHGIIKALEEKLEWLVGTSVNLDVTHEFKKRKYFSNEGRKKKIKCTQVFNVTLLPDRIGTGSLSLFREDCETGGVRCASPSSGSEISFSSGPSFTPPSSPAVCNENDFLGFEESDSDEYSPVCSEVEDADEATSLLEDLDCTFQGNEALFIYDNESNYRVDLESEADSATCSFASGASSLNIALSSEIVGLLKMFARKRPVVTELVSYKLLVTLLKFFCPFNRVFHTVESLPVIVEILKHQEHLLHLMQIDIIPVVYDLTMNIHGDACSVCVYLNGVGQTLLKKFTSLAESSFGRGEIAHCLIRGNLPLKQKLSMVIPYIIRNKTLFGKFMTTYGGLDILIKLLSEQDFQRKSIKSLCAVATRKGIKNPKTDVSLETVELKINHNQYQIKDGCQKVVTFELDDGTSLKADREFLIQQSDFFERLLSGMFKESQEDRVKLCNVERKSLKCLLLLMEKDFKWPQVPLLDLDLPTILDVIVLTDRYLMMDLCNTLVSHVEKFKISPKTAPLIYRWSLESGTNLLRVETVAYALVSNVSEGEKFAMFQSFFDHGYVEQLTDDIQNLLQR
ncbi:uncharacterized protein LOC108742330 [Agrilus planipennis]|uniref:Uncharacterized protein LOC108742330 n=1 Tax=Agrilus planipennis TaxID=224129 RepID=A0A1W4XKL5_AGRPL|nr:uncharacterized protein LOC108742330 [Agrilus planipennis]